MSRGRTYILLALLAFLVILINIVLITNHQTKQVFSVVTPTMRRPQSEYIFILASAMWMNTSPRYAGTTVAHWTILNADQEVQKDSALELVQHRFPLPLKSWWSIVPAPIAQNVTELAQASDIYKAPLATREWQTKENMDYIAALEEAIRAVPECTHIIVFEDDFLPMGNWVEGVLQHMRNHGKGGIHALFDAGLNTYPGTVAQLFERRMAEEFILYLKENINRFPVDWALGNFLRWKRVRYPVASPNLGQHIGFDSTLHRNTSFLMTPDFGPNGRVLPKGKVFT